MPYENAELLIVVEDVPLRGRLASALEAAGLPFSALTVEEVVRLPLVDDSVVVIETRDDVARLVQTVWDVYELNGTAEMLGIIPMVSYPRADRNDMLGAWLIGNHAAVVCIANSIGPGMPADLVDMLRLLLPHGSRAADLGRMLPVSDAESGTSRWLANAVKGTVNHCASTVAAKHLVLDISDKRLNARLSRALTRAGIPVENDQPSRSRWRPDEDDILVWETGDDVSHLVWFTNLYRFHRRHENSSRVLPIVALASGKAIRLNPSLSTWRIHDHPAVLHVLASDARDLSESLVRIAQGRALA